MWSKPFIRTMPGGKKVAVVFIDTQGTFDNKTTMKQNASIFALNSLLSSRQVYNISQLIQEDVLQVSSNACLYHSMSTLSPVTKALLYYLTP